MNPAKLRPYIRADEIKKKESNYQAWLEGLYVFHALQAALSGLSGKKKKVQYLKEPIPMSVAEIEEIERKKQERMKKQFAIFVEGLKGKQEWQEQTQLKQ